MNHNYNFDENTNQAKVCVKKLVRDLERKKYGESKF